jgi:hypothetical protein
LQGGDFGVFRVFGKEIVSHDLYSYYTGFNASGGAGTGIKKGAIKVHFIGFMVSVRGGPVC